MWNINWYGDAYDFGSSRLWFKVTSSHIFNRKSTSSRLLVGFGPSHVGFTKSLPGLLLPLLLSPQGHTLGVSGHRGLQCIDAPRPIKFFSHVFMIFPIILTFVFILNIICVSQLFSATIRPRKRPLQKVLKFVTPQNLSHLRQYAWASRCEFWWRCHSFKVVCYKYRNNFITCSAKS